MTPPGHDVAMRLDDIADELYGLPADQFTAARNARAKDLTSAGDPASAAAVRRLPKPTQTAWLMNTMVRKHPREIAEVLDLGKEVRRALQKPVGDELRRLSSRRRVLVARLLQLVSAEASVSGHRLGTEAQRQAIGTLEAAMADEVAGAALRAGRLTAPLSHIGFGEDTDTGGGTSERPTVAIGRSGHNEKGKGSTTSEHERLVHSERERSRARGVLESADAALDEARQRYEVAADRRRNAAKDLRNAERAMKEASSTVQQATAAQRRAAVAMRAAEREVQRRAVSPAQKEAT
jgi:hypothetical protein